MPPTTSFPRVNYETTENLLASRMILAGVKTAAVINVGFATLGGFIGASLRYVRVQQHTLGEYRQFQAKRKKALEEYQEKRKGAGKAKEKTYFHQQRNIYFLNTCPNFDEQIRGREETESNIPWY